MCVCACVCVCVCVCYSQHRNAPMIRSWRTALEALGFSRWRYVKLEHLHCMAFRKLDPPPLPHHLPTPTATQTQHGLKPPHRRCDSGGESSCLSSDVDPACESQEGTAALGVVGPPLSGDDVTQRGLSGNVTHPGPSGDVISRPGPSDDVTQSDLPCSDVIPAGVHDVRHPDSSLDVKQTDLPGVNVIHRGHSDNDVKGPGPGGDNSSSSERAPDSSGNVEVTGVCGSRYCPSLSPDSLVQRADHAHYASMMYIHQDFSDFTTAVEEGEGVGEVESFEGEEERQQFFSTTESELPGWVSDEDQD